MSIASLDELYFLGFILIEIVIYKIVSLDLLVLFIHFYDPKCSCGGFGFGFVKF